MSKCAFIGIPLQDETRRGRQAVFFERDGEGRRADGIGKRSPENAPDAGRRWLDKEAERCGSRLDPRRMPQQEDRPPGLGGAAVQATRRGKVELPRIAGQFQDGGGQHLQRRRMFGDPQCVNRFRRLRKQQALRVDAEQS